MLKFVVINLIVEPGKTLEIGHIRPHTCDYSLLSKQRD